MANLFSKLDLFDDDGSPRIIDLPPSLAASRLAPYFRRAEAENLAPLLTAPVLALLVAAPAPSDPPTVADVLLGELKATSAMFVGLHALAKYWPFSQTVVTGFSAVRKLVDESEPLDVPTLTRQQNEFLNSAKVYEAQLRDFLTTNRDALALLTAAPASPTCDPVPARPGTPPVSMLAIRKPGRDERFF